MVLWLVSGTDHLGWSKKSGSADTLFLVLLDPGVFAGLGFGHLVLPVSLYLTFLVGFVGWCSLCSSPLPGGAAFLPRPWVVCLLLSSFGGGVFAPKKYYYLNMYTC